MTTDTLQTRPTLRLFPLYRSELSRTTHRRLFRVLALLLLGGIIVVSAITFLVSRDSSGLTVAELQKNQAEEQGFFDQCVQASPPDKVQRFCGQDPSQRPLESFSYGTDRRYKANDNLPAVVLATVVGVAGVAFIVGASTGGAEWSSRSMTLQLLWEPRRLRLLIVKWLALISVSVVLALIAVLLGVGLGSIVASLHGTWDGHPPSDLGTDLSQILIGMTLRGLVFVAVAATFGYAIAILVRNTGAALGAAFVYFAVAETALRLALMKYGPEPFLLSTNSVAFLIPGGVDVPGATPSSSGSTGLEEINDLVHLSNVRSLFTMLCYASLIVIPAGWSFSRRDVG